ncbi:MAG: DUF1749 domain-containing protein [Clostridia bacterium]|nr:DUF1749 domain-containing protein [Clostridium sp.]
MEQIEFLATDGIILDGLLYKSKERTNKVILAVHGMSSNCMKKRDQVISKKANENNIDYFCFNNRGSELVKYTRRNIEGKKEKFIMGTSFEDVTEGYEDIVGAMIKLKELGYEEIYLQGHSLGCTKIVYSYNELKEEQDDLINMVKGVILLSLVDIPQTLKFYLRENFNKYLEYAEEQEKQNKPNELMPKESFIHPISVKTFLRYARDNKEIDFAGYGRDTKLEKLNNIDVPLFMRWGNDNEMILQRAEELVDIVNNILKNENKDIDYIDGANHGYENREEELAEQIIKFII